MWEYTTIEQRPGWTEDLRVQLNALGSLGWEVVGFASAAPAASPTQIHTVVLKREVAPWPAPADIAAAWAPDPTHRFERRWWDGLRWTENVVDIVGAQSVDLPTRR